MKRKSEESSINKRIKQSSGSHVHGPLDPSFGQHRAFPVEIPNISSYQPHIPEDVETYLAMVRFQAGGNADDDEFVFYELTSNAEKLHYPEWHTQFIEFFQESRQEYRNFLTATDCITEIEQPQSIQSWKNFIFKNDPTFEFLAQLDHVTVIKLLVYLTRWLTKKINPKFSRWCLLLFVVLDDTLDSTDVSNLRTMAQKAVKIRKELNEMHEAGTFHCDDVTGMCLDSLVSVIGDFYGQRDLLERE